MEVELPAIQVVIFSFLIEGPVAAAGRANFRLTRKWTAFFQTSREDSCQLSAKGDWGAGPNQGG
jgi:hypothetical protein